MEAWKEELYHHGIKGQRWGIRRFQNEDGTRTAAGRRQERLNNKYGNGGEYTQKALKKYNKAVSDQERVHAYAKSPSANKIMRRIYKQGADRRVKLAEKGVKRADLVDKANAYKGGRYRHAANVVARAAGVYALGKFTKNYATKKISELVFGPKQKELIYDKVLGRPVDVERLKDVGSKAVIAAGAAALVGWGIHNAKVGKQLRARDKQYKSEYKAEVRKAKRDKGRRDRAIQKQYDEAERQIESKYSRGDTLSPRDRARSDAINERAGTSWAASKQTYKQERKDLRRKYRAQKWKP